MLVVLEAVTRTLVALYPAAPPVKPETVMTVPTDIAVVMAVNVNVATDPVPDAPVIEIVVAVLVGSMKYDSGVNSSVLVFCHAVPLICNVPVPLVTRFRLMLVSVPVAVSEGAAPVADPVAFQ